MRFIDLVFVYQMHEERDIRWHSRVHFHDINHYELHYFINGSGHFLHGGTAHRIKPGTIFLCSPYEKHAILVSKQTTPLTYYAVLFETGGGDDKDLHDLVENMIPEKPFYLIGSNYRFYFEELRQKIAGGNPNLLRSASHQFISFLYLLPEKDYEYHHSDSGNVHIEKALRLMQSSIFSRTELSDITLRLGLSEAYFIRLFKKKMKITPMKYLTGLKIEAAKSMLMSSGQPVYKIAEQLKFYSEFHFSRVFKQYTGESPSVFRGDSQPPPR